MTRSPQELRELARATAQASDAQLMKLVGTLDAMPKRGDADTLLAQVRNRLRGLNPRRPLNLARLLFVPLDALIVPARDWKPGRGQVPRSVIAPLAWAIAAAHPALAEEMRHAMQGRSLDQMDWVGPLGQRLWPVAAGTSLIPPAAAAEAGLPTEAWAEVLATCRLLWRHGMVVWGLRSLGPQGPAEARARPLLQRVAPDGPAAISLVLGATLPYAAQPSRLAAMAASLGPHPSPVGEQALDRFIAEVRLDLEGVGLGSVAQSAERFAGLLEDLHTTLGPGHVARAQRLRELKHAAGLNCIARLDGEAGPKLAQAVHVLAIAAEVPDGTIETLEASAGALRALADSARRLDRAPAAEAALRPAIVALRQCLPALPPHGPGLRRADALRLLELLEGPEAASRA